ncbi:hypothetical protein DPMN_184306 [Dreissena polymorpha]|uniref:Uncharacterized protein n=1 Tax=Dreissena polymorpha TaxID=45954 RepID=A0A9D4DIZ6_DREPO|nr:hypothetical protein DPMN_184306 [Dreissena polymorpha]
MHPSINSSHIRKLGGVESAPQKAHRQQSGDYHVRHALITNLPTNDKFTMFQPVLCGVSFNEQHSPKNTLSIFEAPTSTYPIEGPHANTTPASLPVHKRSNIQVPANRQF